MAESSSPLLIGWHADWSVLMGLLLLTGAYLLGTGPGVGHFSPAKARTPKQTTLFLSGVLVLFLTLESPLHDLGERYLFSAHMVQHMLLTLVAAPLLLMGTPGWLVAPVFRSPIVRQIVLVLVRPPLAFAIYNGFLAFSHLPMAYDLALRDHNVHIVQHTVYLLAALVMWMPLLSPVPEVPRLSQPGQMLYVFAQTLPAFGVGAMITFSEEVLYPTYALAPRLWGLSALDDQRLGGLIMWVVGSLAYLAVLTAIFFAWASREEAASRPSSGELAQRSG